MSHLSHEEIRHHVKIYISVFLALAFLTIVTVAISTFHLPVLPAICIALLIASIKGSLVAAFFMHLSTEKKIILSILVLAAVFFLALLILPALTSA